MRASTEEEHNRFLHFIEERQKLQDMQSLQEVDSSSSQILQIITFHLVYEYLVEKWLDFKVNNGSPLFKGVEKVGFHNKLYLAKNIGMPKGLFEALGRINKERNNFAHKIFKNGLSEAEIRRLGEIADRIDIESGKFSTIQVPFNGKHVSSSQTQDPNILLYILLRTLLNHLDNFVFSDVHLSNSVACS